MFKLIAGKSYQGITESTFDSGLGFSLGAGVSVSKRSSIEVSYMHLDFDKTTLNKVSEPLDMFGVAFKYRLF